MNTFDTILNMEKEVNLILYAIFIDNFSNYKSQIII